MSLALGDMGFHHTPGAPFVTASPVTGGPPPIPQNHHAPRGPHQPQPTPSPHHQLPPTSTLSAEGATTYQPGPKAWVNSPPQALPLCRRPECSAAKRQNCPPPHRQRLQNLSTPQTPTTPRKPNKTNERYPNKLGVLIPLNPVNWKSRSSQKAAPGNPGAAFSF